MRNVSHTWINSSRLILKASSIKIFKRRVSYILPFFPRFSSKIFHWLRSFAYITIDLLPYITHKRVISCHFISPASRDTHARRKLEELVCLSVRTPTIVLAPIAARSNCLHDNFAKTGIKLIRNYWLRSRGHARKSSMR